jgi:hypothetical protein
MATNISIAICVVMTNFARRTTIKTMSAMNRPATPSAILRDFLFGDVTLGSAAKSRGRAYSRRLVLPTLWRRATRSNSTTDRSRAVPPFCRQYPEVYLRRSAGELTLSVEHRAAPSANAGPHPRAPSRTARRTHQSSARLRTRVRRGLSEEPASALQRWPLSIPPTIGCARSRASAQPLHQRCLPAWLSCMGGS